MSHAEAKYYQPSNITLGIMPPLPERPAGRARRGGGASKKTLRNEALATRALAALERWQPSLTDAATPPTPAPAEAAP